MREVQAFLIDQKKAGKTILFSSHTMSEVEKLCDRIAVIHKGSLVDIGETEELLGKYGTQSLEELFVRLAGDGR